MRYIFFWMKGVLLLNLWCVPDPSLLLVAFSLAATTCIACEGARLDDWYLMHASCVLMATRVLLGEELQEYTAHCWL